MAARTYGLGQRVVRSAMRRGAILAWLALGAACGGLPEPASGETELDALSREAKRKVSVGTCPPPKVPADQPELIGWDQGSRGTLHSITNQGVPVVYFKALGCDITLELQSRCVDKTHKYSYSRNQGEASRSASNELGLYSDFPVGAGGLRAKLSGGKEIRAQIFEVGVQRIEIGADIHMADLTGDCARATHVVAAIHRGAFVIAAATTDAFSGGVSLLGASADASTRERFGVFDSGGIYKACDDPTDPLEKGCNAPLRIELKRIVDGFVDPVAAPPPKFGPAPEHGVTQGPLLPSPLPPGVYDPVRHAPVRPPAVVAAGPANMDGDGVIDIDDACPNVAGVTTNHPTTNGCPPDSDDDTIRDDRDACPREKGVSNADPTKDGCPLVQLTETEIVISQQVQFETDRAPIKSESDGLLDAVARVIMAHPEIVKIEIQSHTDGTGGKAFNRSLSRARALGVLQALVKRGIDPDKLVSRGYGSDVPIADNETEAGKKKNRRIQFKIVGKK